jgi:hypothetical protein
VLTLAVAVGTALAVASIWRLRRDARVIEAAENFEAVDLTTVVKRYVPAEQQTNVPSEEIAIVKQALAARRPRQKRIAIVLGMILLSGATATVFSAHRHLETAVVAGLTAQPQLSLEVLKVIQGVWGSRANFLESCSENPQTIRVAPDQKTLTLRYAKPYKAGSNTTTDMTFDVVSVKRNALVLLWAGTPAAIKRRRADVQFIDGNTMSWSVTDDVMVWVGAIERCLLAQRTPVRQ